VRQAGIGGWGQSGWGQVGCGQIPTPGICVSVDVGKTGVSPEINWMGNPEHAMIDNTSMINQINFLITNASPTNYLRG
jgi:hypothetical protein